MSNNFGKRLISCILAIVLVLGYIPVPARATQEDGVCPHHTQHTPECGYVPAVEGQPCGHVHTEDCDPECDCTHEDCGYVEASEEQPCLFVCEVCAAGAETTAETTAEPGGDTDEASTGSPSVVGTDAPEVPGTEPPVEALLPMQAPEQSNLIASGTCGQNLTWAYTDDGTLTISGEGEMDDYTFAHKDNKDTFTTSAPWFGYPYRQLVLEEGITAIGNWAFACSGLSGEVEIPEGVVRIGDSAFKRDPELTGLQLPESLEIIDSYMAGESGLETVHIPAGVQWISNGAFLCPNLRQITVAQDNPYFLAENGLLYSADQAELLAVAGAALTEIVIPDTLTELSSDLFRYATGLERLHIGSGVTSFGWDENPLSNCKMLQQITVSPDNTVFSAEDGVLFDGTTLLCYPAAKTDGCYTVPEGTRKLGRFSLSGNPYLQELILPDGMWAIQNGAGLDCESLCSVTIPASVAFIDDYFLGDSRSVVIRGYPGTAAELYANERHWTFVSLEQSTTGADSGTCGEGLTWTIHGSTLTISGTGAMADYDFLPGETPNSPYGGANTPWHSRLITDLVIEEGVSYIGNEAFYSLGQLQSVSLPGSLRRIGDSAFADCGALEQIDLPEGLEELGSHVFFQCIGLSSLTLPASLRTIGDSALCGCQLSHIAVASGNTAFCVEDGALYTADRTRLLAFTSNRNTLTIPDSVTTIDASAWADGFNLSSISVGAGLTDLYGWAFHLANLEQIQVSDANEHLKTVDGVLFTKDGTELILYPNASGNAAYAVPNGTQTIRSFAFGNCPGLTRLSLPEGLLTLDYNCVWCTDLQELTIPASVETMEDGCVGFSYGMRLENFTISGYSGTVAQTYAAENGFAFVPLTAEELTLTFDVQGGIGGPEDMTASAGQTLSLPETAPTRTGYRFCGWTLTPGSMVASYQPGDSIIRYRDTTLYAVWLPESVANAGKCGDNLVWTLSNDGTLTISGTGRMYDYYYQPDGNGNYIPTTPMPALNATRLVIEEGVTYIGYSAFRDCVTLTGDLVIPSTVTSIANSAFENCTGFDGRLVLPEKLTSLGAWAFMKCGFTGDLVIPEGVMTIGNSTFSDCGFDGKLVLPDSVRYIERYAFGGCSRLTGSLTLPKGLKRIGEGAFFGCSGFTGTLTLPDTLTNLGSYAFCSCSGITGDLTLPGSFVYIADYAFSWCDSLSSVTIQEGTQAIGNQTFASCKKISNLTLPGSLIEVGASAFSGIDYSGTLVCSYNGTPEQWAKVTIGRDNQALTEAAMIYQSAPLSGTCGENLTWTLSNDGTLTISGTGEMDGMLAQYIECVGPWKEYQDEIRSVVIEEGVTSIGDQCFTSCSNLESVTIADTVERIGHYAFLGTGLKQVSIPASVREIGLAAFSNCPNLERFLTATANAYFRVVDGVLYYRDMKYLLVYPAKKADESFTVPASVTRISSYAFKACTGLKSVTIPDSVTAIDSDAFCGCTSLRSVTIPDSVTIIGSYAFERCTSLVSVTIPSGITTIERATFRDCTSLTELVIPDSVESIEEEAFARCAGLTSLKLGKNLIFIDGGAFSSCTGLKGELVIPESVTEIGANVLNRTAIDTVLFRGNTAPAALSNGLAGMEQLKAIYVPLASLSAYQESCGTALSGKLRPYDSRPAKITVANLTTESVTLQWAPIAGALSYQVVRDDSLTSTTTEATFRDALKPGEMHTYTVTANLPCGLVGETSEIQVAAPLPEILSITTDNGSVITTHINTLYAKIDGKSEGLTGTFYYSKDEQNVEIASGLTGTDQNGVGVFTANWENQELPEGEYSVTFVLTSSFGVTESLDQTITVDHSVPARIVGLRADGDVRNVTLSWGIAEELATNVYRVYRKTAAETEFALLREITGRNNHSYVDTACEVGTEYDYYVVGVNKYGEESDPSVIVRSARTPDTEAPRVLRIVPASGTSVRGVVTVIAEAEDNLAVTGLQLLLSRDDGKTWSEWTQGTSGKLNAQLDSTAYPDGTLKLKTIAWDAAGNESDPMICTLTVDNTGPEQVSGLRYEATSVTVTLHWNDVSDEDVAYFLVERAEADGSFTSIARVKALGINITGLTPGGDYAYRVTAYDRLGNMGTPSEAIAVSTLSDTTAPVITKLSPAPGYYSKSIPLRITAEDDYHIAGVRVEVSTNLINWTEVDSREFTDLSARRQASFTLKLDEFDEGSLFVRAVAWDNADHESNTGVDAPYVQYIVDRTPPAAPEITATGYAGYAEIRWAKGTEADLNRYTVYRSETESGTFKVIASGLNTLNYIDRNVADNGVYFYKVAVSDQAGNVSELSAAAGVQIDPDTVAPDIVSIYPADGSVLNAGSAQVSVLARDNSKLDRIVAEYSLDGELFTELGRVEANGTSSKTGQWKLPAGILRDDAQITVRAYAVDAAGLESDYVTAEYTVDNQAPGVGTATATYDDNAVVVRWKSQMEQDLLGYQVYRVAGNGSRTQVGARKAVADQLDYVLTDTSIPLAKGTYTYYIEALDTCGNAGGVTTDPVELPDRSYPKPVLHFDYTMEAAVEYLFDATDSADNGRIVSYQLDFGDGTTASEAKSIHRYQNVGTYTLVLTVTDDDGNVSTLTDTVTVKERTEIGKVEITVVDQNGVPVPNAQVYFDLGETTQIIRKTDGSGVVTFTTNSGKHNVGCFIADNNWLPVKKAVVARAGATERLKMIMVRQTMIEGSFEIDRMTFEEIVAAGIDISEPENQHIMHFNVQLSYGEYQQPVKSSFKYNPTTNKIIDPKPTIVEKPDGERRKVTPVGIIGGGGGKGGTGGSGGSGGGTSVENTAVVILDIPAEASFLKEFFDVKLHIINNAGSEFEMRDNFVTLNVPAGLSIVDTVATEGGAVVYIPTIVGQSTCTIPWILRGDAQGDYLLDADYSGVLSQFNETILTTFRADEPIHVYGKQAVKLLVEANSSSMYGAYYFNLGITNDSPIEVNMPSVDVVGNVISAYLQGSEEQGRHPEVHILGMEVRSQSGVVQKLAADTQVNTLAPGETMVKRCAVYNAVDAYDYLVLKNASIRAAEDCDVEIIFKEVDMELFDLKDAMDKLGEIRSDPNKQSMYQRIKNDSNYAYVWEAVDRDTSFLSLLAEKEYAAAKFLFEGEFFYNNEQNKKFTRQLVCTLLQDEAMEQIIADRVDTEALDIVVKMLKTASGALKAFDEPEDDLHLDLAKKLTELSGDADAVRSLANALVKEDGATFEDRLVNYVVSYAEAGVGEVLREYLVDTDFVVEVMMDVYSDVFKCFGDAAGLVAEGIKSWNDAAQYAAELANIAAAQEESIALLDMLVENCEDGTPMRKELESIRKEIEDTVKAQRKEFLRELTELGLSKITTAGIKKVIGWVFGAEGKTVLFIVKCTFKSVDSKFDWQGGSDDKHALRVCLQMSDVLGRAAIRYPLTTENETEAVYIMRALKYLVKMRLVGEQTYVDQMKDQSAGKQETALAEMNAWLSSNYSSFDAYMTYLYETLPAYRDSLFRKAPAQDILKPAAPQVTLDFLAHATVESFDSRYEYSYNGENWSVCDGGPIQVEPKHVGSSLWVRVRATDDSLTGNIAKLAVPAQPRILGDLTATHDGNYYVVTGLNAGVYRVGFKRAETPAEQFQTVQVSGSGILTVSKTEKFALMTIQSPASTTSFESLVREVPVENIALPDNACGDDLIWLMDSRGVLTISGTGAMWDYASIGAAPWYGENITGLVLEEGITRIGNNAFADLNLKGALKLPETLREIGSSAFDGCTGLTGILTIPSGVTEIGTRAFYGCTGLSGTVRIPAAVGTLGVNAFGSCTRLTAFTVDAGNPTMTAVAGVLYSADGTILLVCPAGKLNMTAVPEGTETIGACAFSGCVNVKKLTIPTSLTCIESDAFIGCTNLRDVFYQGTMDEWRQIYGSDCLSGVKMHVLYQIFYGNLPETCTNPNPAYGSSDTLLYLKNPTAVGYTFGGWYLNEDLTQKVTSIASGRTEALTLYAKMTPNTYYIRYNGNGSSGGKMPVTTAVYDEPFLLEPNTFVRMGYTFDGWMRSQYGKEAEFTDAQDMDVNLTTAKGGTVTLYAHWNPNPYEVRFDSNGGEGEMSTQEFVYGQSRKLTLNAFTRRGYSFAGWNTQPDGKGTGYANAASIKNLADGETVTEVTLYAMWKANSYTVTFHANGGRGRDTKQTLTYDRPASLMKPSFTRTGCAIDGWMLKADGEAVDYDPAQEVLNLAASGNVDLYAHWRYSKYTIAFHANGGAGETPSMERTYNDYLDGSVDTSLPDNGFIRVGYDFAGWATSSRGAVVYKDGVKADKNLTAADGATVNLYAVWTPHVYTVVFNPGCDNATGTMKNLTNRKYDTAFALTANAFKRTGYTFVGWSLKPDADVEFTNKQSVLNLTSEQNGIVTLYAVWKANDYTITYKNITTAERGAFGLPRNYSIEQQVFLPGSDVVRRDGYTFGGWYTDGKYRNPVSSIALGSTGNRTLYAKWTANQYTVVFDSGALDVGSVEKLYTYSKSFNLPDVTSALKFTKPGYRFVGWQMEDGTLLKNKQSVKNLALDGEVTLTAQWQRIVYKITYKNVTAMEVGECPATYTVEDSVMLPWLEADVRPGCTFEGWFTDAYYKKPFEDFDAGRTGNLTIYAKWSGTAKTYQVSFDKNDPSATGTMRAMTKLIPGREYTLTANAFSLRGYTFTGWEAENAKVDTLDNRQKFSSLAQDNASTVTLKACWEPTVYKITYKNILPTDDNADNPATYTVASDEVFLNEPIRDGYTFGGWYTDTYLKKPFVSIPQGEIGNRTVYAKWIANSYTVIFSSGDGEGAPAEKTFTYKYNTTYTLPDVTRSLKFTKPGYQFTGWLVTVSGEPKMLANQARVKNLVPDGEVELVAQWEPIAYKITYKNLTAMEVEAAGNPLVYTVDDQFELKEPSRPGCTFEGWFLDSACKKAVTGIEADTTGRKTFYAKWTGKASTYSIHFEGNGATSGVMRDQTGLVCGKEYALTANAFKRTGYTFLGWSTEEQSVEPELMNKQKVSTLIAEGETFVTLYAVWAPKEYTIRYRNVTAGEAEINSGAYTVEDPVQFNAPQREGYTFLGWYIDGKPVEGTENRSGNLIVYARWEKAE